MENNPAEAPPRHVAAAVVSAGEEEEASSSNNEEESSVGSHAELLLNTEHDDDLYNKDMDDEDEAWVYKHMRGGVQEKVKIFTQENTTTTTKKVLKPRNSDAVLSCPCCFTIVCMDCQRHAKYENQFRAMFVMNIAVDWDKRLVYSHREKKLVIIQPTTRTTSQESNRVVVDHDVVSDPTTQPSSHHQEEEFYYSVHCNNCQTEVAALNMEDEVYHFFGCLESA